MFALAIGGLRGRHRWPRRGPHPLPAMIHLLAHWLGLDNGSGVPYLAWSGAGADLGELAILGGLISICRRHNCHVRRCLRIGRAPVTGTNFHTCWRHHPEGKPTHHHILAAHRAHNERLAADRKDGSP